MYRTLGEYDKFRIGLQIFGSVFQHVNTSSANKNTSEKTAVQQTADFLFQYRTQKIKVQKLYISRGKEADSILLCPLNSSTDIHSHIKSLVLTVF